MEGCYSTCLCYTPWPTKYAVAILVVCSSLSMMGGDRVSLATLQYYSRRVVSWSSVFLFRDIMLYFWWWQVACCEVLASPEAIAIFLSCLDCLFPCYFLFFFKFDSFSSVTTSGKSGICRRHFFFFSLQGARVVFLPRLLRSVCFYCWCHQYIAKYYGGHKSYASWTFQGRMGA